VYILGINAYHGDSSACLIRDGVLVAAAEEERFARVKHWAGFPKSSIDYCLKYANIDLSDIQYIAINQRPNARLLEKFLFVFKKKISIKMVLEKLLNKSKRSNIHLDFRRHYTNKTINTKLRFIEHHTSHLASAFLVSNFNDSVIVSVDGFGDFASTSWGVGYKNKIEKHGDILFPHSLGIFYQALTQYLGFLNYGDEYKVMGLAPYGRPIYIDFLKNIVLLNQDNGIFKLDLSYFRHHNQKIDYEWVDGSPRVGILFTKKLTDLLGESRKCNEPINQKHMDLAASIQKMYENALFNLLNFLYKKYQKENLCIAGGCGMNSVANGKIYSETPFKNLYVQAAAGDAGGAIGAGYYLYNCILGNERQFYMDHAYWGPSFDNTVISKIFIDNEKNIIDAKCIYELLSENELIEQIALAISKGEVVGWYQGRMEWGPRALGNRSILGDPRRLDMKDILNLKIKRRESFRPFAPSIISEYASEWFDGTDKVPFMMQVYQVKKEKQSQLPAVTHVDGSGRLQTVEVSTNPRYYKLIEKFRQITGVPILLNTSFNENEPIVCTPQEALNCFLRTKMDKLAIGDYLIKRLH
jgi:carbamoyltransferase